MKISGSGVSELLFPFYPYLQLLQDLRQHDHDGILGNESYRFCEHEHLVALREHLLRIKLEQQFTSHQIQRFLQKQRLLTLTN